MDCHLEVYVLEIYSFEAIFLNLILRHLRQNRGGQEIESALPYFKGTRYVATT